MFSGLRVLIPISFQAPPVILHCNHSLQFDLVYLAHLVICRPQNWRGNVFLVCLVCDCAVTIESAGETCATVAVALCPEQTGVSLSFILCVLSGSAPRFMIAVIPSAVTLISSANWLRPLPSHPTSIPNSLYLSSPPATLTKQEPVEVVVVGGTRQLRSFPVTSACDIIPEWGGTAAISVSIQPVIPKPRESQLWMTKMTTCVCVGGGEKGMHCDAMWQAYIPSHSQRF